MARELLLLHSSDLHVQDPWPGLSPVPRAGLDGLAAVLDAARTHAADVILLAGDTFDNHRVSGPVLARAAALLMTAPAPVVVLPGNHDAALPDCLFRRAGLTDMPGVAVLGVTHGEVVPFAALDLDVVGRAHRGRNDLPPLATLSRRARWQVVMAHGHYVAPADWRLEAHRSWRIGDDDLAACGADYVALGHWDRWERVGRAAYYSGSPDLTGTVNLVRLREDTEADVTRVPL